METYNENVLIDVVPIQKNVQDFSEFLKLEGQQPAHNILCVILPIGIDVLNVFSQVTKNFWVRLVIGSIITALTKFEANKCSKPMQPTRIQ